MNAQVYKLNQRLQHLRILSSSNRLLQPKKYLKQVMSKKYPNCKKYNLKTRSPPVREYNIELLYMNYEE